LQNNASRSPVKKKPDHLLNVAAHQMEVATAKAEVADKDRLRQETAEKLKAEQAGERAVKLVSHHAPLTHAQPCTMRVCHHRVLTFSLYGSPRSRPRPTLLTCSVSHKRSSSSSRRRATSW